MNYIKFIHLSVFCAIITLLAFFNIVYSYYLNLYLNLNTYVYTFLVSIFLTVLFYISKNNNKNQQCLEEKKNFKCYYFFSRSEFNIKMKG